MCPRTALSSCYARRLSVNSDSGAERIRAFLIWHLLLRPVDRRRTRFCCLVRAGHRACAAFHFSRQAFPGAQSLRRRVPAPFDRFTLTQDVSAVWRPPESARGDHARPGLLGGAAEPSLSSPSHPRFSFLCPDLFFERTADRTRRYSDLAAVAAVNRRLTDFVLHMASPWIATRQKFAPAVRVCRA